MNALQYLQQNKGEKPDFYDIVDFVPGLLVAKEKIVVPGSEGRLVFESGPRRPKIENISPFQWQAANARIMYQLIVDGKLGGQGILDYLAYTVKIGQLGERFEWPTVLFYDRQYRELQAQLGFQWATDNPHLHRVYLKEKPVGKQNQGRSKGSNQTARQNTVKGQTDPNTGKEICINYNRDEKNACTYGDNCKFLHVCTTCHKAHAKSEHSKDV